MAVVQLVLTYFIIIRSNSMSNINFNELAWKSPKHDGKYGYIPTDDMYEEIINWLKSGKELWREEKGNLSQFRVTFKNSMYDVIAVLDRETDMISWIFRSKGDYGNVDVFDMLNKYKG